MDQLLLIMWKTSMCWNSDFGWNEHGQKLCRLKIHLNNWLNLQSLLAVKIVWISKPFILNSIQQFNGRADTQVWFGKCLEKQKTHKSREKKHSRSIGSWKVVFFRFTHALILLSWLCFNAPRLAQFEHHFTHQLKTESCVRWV